MNTSTLKLIYIHSDIRPTTCFDKTRGHLQERKIQRMDTFKMVMWSLKQQNQSTNIK
jgi:hypothetical protein